MFEPAHISTDTKRTTRNLLIVASITLFAAAHGLQLQKLPIISNVLDGQGGAKIAYKGLILCMIAIGIAHFVNLYGDCIRLFGSWTQSVAVDIASAKNDIQQYTETLERLEKSVQEVHDRDTAKTDGNPNEQQTEFSGGSQQLAALQKDIRAARHRHSKNLSRVEALLSKTSKSSTGLLDHINSFQMWVLVVLHGLIPLGITSLAIRAAARHL